MVTVWCDRYLIGEEGYCLTSLQSALSYVESLQ